MVCGVRENEFWDMTPKEINHAITAYNKREEINRRNRAVFDYKLAIFIASNMARVLSGKGEVPEIYDVYPSLFDQEEQLEDNTNKVANQFLQYALTYNNQVEKEGDINGS